MSEVIGVRVDDERYAAFVASSKEKGFKKVSEWLRAAGDAFAGYCPPANKDGQVPITPGVEVESEPVPDAPKSEKQVAFDPAKGDVTVEPLPGMESSGKTRPFDPNGGPVTYEPVPGVKSEPKQRTYNPKGGEVRAEPVKTYERSHHPRCPCLMCTGKPEAKSEAKKQTEPLKEGEKVYTGETTKFQGRTLYEIDTDKGKRWTATPPE